MDKKALQKYLSDGYQGWDSFYNTVIFPIFGDDKYDDEQKDYTSDWYKQAASVGIKSIIGCGRTYVGYEPLYFFDITVSDKVLMERNKVNIRKVIFDRIEHYSNAFMIFHYEGEEKWQWRFSYCYKKQNDNDSTDRKRFTFLLGKGQSCRTAAENFYALYEKRQKDEIIAADDLINAFNVEALSQEFFDKYREQYANIIEHVTGKRMVKKNNKWEETDNGNPNVTIMQEFDHFDNPEKAVRDYVKKLMGRLVFLQFLQKKGWLGVPVNEKWGSGKPNFMQDLFDKTEDKTNFIDNVLEVLFNDLNTERTNDLASSVVGNNIRVPYLNGGLFERDAADETRFPLEPEYLDNLFKFFGNYNFTIDENDPDDAEVGVDPEMLGRIFENLLEDNKDKGAFYTPKEIVTYMCRESLIAYLQTDVDDEPTKEAIHRFVITHDADTLGNITDDIDQRLKNVKVCDPAIGSGAFPMGLLKELFLCRTALEGIDQSKAAEIKKHIIQQNIYGVDIERGAVDIARLRFWLSLIVDEETPQALPNLDFKIMQGNSLLEQYKGVDLSTMTDAKWNKNESLSFFEDMLDVLRRELRIMIAQYYGCTNHKEKQKLKAKIIKNVKQQLSEQHVQTNFDDISLDGNDQFFLWHTWFNDVFAQGGFDVVIANPPYIKERDNKNVFDTITNTKWGEKYHAGKMDYWYYFLHKAIELTHNQAYICYITSRYWINSSGSKKLIRHINETASFVSILDIGSLKLFDNVVGHHMVALYKKGKTIKECLYCRIKDTTENITYQKYDTQKYIHNDSIISDDLEVVVEDRTELDVSSTLKDYCKISQGVVEASDKISSRMYKNQPDEQYHVGQGIFVLTRDELNSLNISMQEKDLVRDYLGDGAITRYKIDYSLNKYLIYSDEQARHLIKTSPDYQRIKEHLNHMSKYITSCWKPYGIHRARKRDYFESPKIITPSMFAHPLFAIDMNNIYVGMSFNVLIPFKQEYIYCLTGILNSKFAENWFYKNAKHRGVGVDVGVDKLREFPIPKLDTDISLKITELVKNVMFFKDSGSDTSDLESEIDRLVYQLYGLTEDEIQIIENKE